MLHEADYAELNARQAAQLEQDLLKYDFSGADNYQREAIKTLQAGAPLIYMAGQLMSEANEIFAPVNKRDHHGKPLDIAALKKEVGDVLWYSAAIANFFGWSLSEVMEENIIKLRARHGQQYNQSYYVPDNGKESEQQDAV